VFDRTKWVERGLLDTRTQGKGLQWFIILNNCFILHTIIYYILLYCCILYRHLDLDQVRLSRVRLARRARSRCFAIRTLERRTWSKSNPHPDWVFLNEGVRSLSRSRGNEHGVNASVENGILDKQSSFCVTGIAQMANKPCSFERGT
jgi:hypothetical protein